MAAEPGAGPLPALGDLTGPILAGLIGICIGSFVSTLALRAADGWQGMWTGRSYCRSCGTTLGPADLVPVLSWLASRGRCRHCGVPVSPYYPAVELGAAAIGSLALTILAGPQGCLAALLGWWLLALALIDLEAWILPDALTLPLIAAGLAASALQLTPSQSFLDAAMGAVGGYLALAGIGYLYEKLRGRDGVGRGDAKLLAAAGAWLGPASLPWVVLVAAILGLLLALARTRSLRAEMAVPFGPPLALAFWGLYLLSA